MFYAHNIRYNIFNFYKWEVKIQSISSTMKCTQIEGVCIFRTLSFLYDTGIIKLIVQKDKLIYLHNN